MKDSVNEELRMKNEIFATANDGAQIPLLLEGDFVLNRTKSSAGVVETNNVPTYLKKKRFCP